jgi:hypothetical protein
MSDYSVIHKSLPLSIPISQSVAVIEERQECLRIVLNRLKLAAMCGSTEGVKYCEMIEAAIMKRGSV